MNNKNEPSFKTTFHKINSENVNDFVEQCLPHSIIDLSDVNDIDSAGLQGLLALKKKNMSFKTPTDTLKEKLVHAGAYKYLLESEK